MGGCLGDRERADGLSLRVFLGCPWAGGFLGWSFGMGLGHFWERKATLRDHPPSGFPESGGRDSGGGWEGGGSKDGGRRLAWVGLVDVGLLVGGQLYTEKPELHEVPGHSCNSGAQKSPKTTPREPPRGQHPRTPRTRKMILLFFVTKVFFLKMI